MWPQYGRSPLENMEAIREICGNYAHTFGPRSGNLLFTGAPGLGKTFLSACIAREVSDHGFSVVYDTAAHVFQQFESGKFGRDNPYEEDPDREINRYLNCDLLLMDDLGSEMTTAFVVSALYRIVNDRLMSGRKTILSTNLTPEKIGRRYSGAVLSPAGGRVSRSSPSFGEDIRKEAAVRGRETKAGDAPPSFSNGKTAKNPRVSCGDQRLPAEWRSAVANAAGVCYAESRRKNLFGEEGRCHDAGHSQERVPPGAPALPGGGPVPGAASGSPGHGVPPAADRPVQPACPPGRLLCQLGDHLPGRPAGRCSTPPIWASRGTGTACGVFAVPTPGRLSLHRFPGSIPRDAGCRQLAALPYSAGVSPDQPLDQALAGKVEEIYEVMEVPEALPGPSSRACFR